MLEKVFSTVLYFENGGFFAKRNLLVNLHLIVDSFICYALMGSIAVEVNVQIVEVLQGDSTLLKVSSVIGLAFSLIANAILTKKELIIKVRRYFCILSLLATLVVLASNAFMILENSIVIRFLLNTAINNSIFTLLSICVSDTMNNLFEGSDRTVFQNKDKVMSRLAALIGVVLAFFIKLDINGLYVFESIIYSIMLLDDLLIMRKLQEYVFEEKDLQK